MKILFINISDIQGGSAKAAYKLGKVLEKRYKTENLFLVRTKRSNDGNVISTRSDRFIHNIERGINILFNLAGFQYYFLPFSPRKILKEAKKFQPDVISLNNTIGGYFKTSDLKKLSSIAPVVWTFHDMWPVTGNASHTYGNTAWKKLRTFRGEGKIFPWVGVKWGRMLIKRKKRIYADSDFNVVAPSKWLYDITCESPLLKNKSKYLIHHGIDESVFYPEDKITAKEKLGIDTSAKVMLFVAEKLKKSKTGLFEIINRLAEKNTENLTFVILGQNNNEKFNLPGINVITPGYINDEQVMRTYYSAADMFIYPTKAESFGLAIAESLACGTPCLTYDLGPLPELVVDGVSGYLFGEGNTIKLADKAAKVINDPELLTRLSMSSAKYFKDNFTLTRMGEKYYNLFMKVTRENQ